MTDAAPAAKDARGADSGPTAKDQAAKGEEDRDKTDAAFGPGEGLISAAAEPAGEAGRSTGTPVEGAQGGRTQGRGAPPAGDDKDLAGLVSFEEPPRPELSVPEVSRRRLVLPVITILFISFLSIFAFLWATSRALDEDAQARDHQLAESLLASQRLALEAGLRDNATSGGAALNLVQRPDPAWVGAVLGPRLRRDFEATSTWVLSPEGETLAAFVDDRVGDRAVEAYFTSGLSDLLGRLAEGGAEDRHQVSGYLDHDRSLHFVVAARVLGPDGVVQPSAPTMLVSQALDESFLIRGGINYTLPGLVLNRGPVPEGHEGIALLGEAAKPQAHLIWRQAQPGDGLLWPLSPALAAALIAIGYFLLLFVRGADLFMERQAYLAASLHQEQNLRNLKSRFVSMVSHELRTPLTTIRSAADLLERYGERMSVADRIEEARAIHRSVDALSRLVDNVLVIGRSDWLTGDGELQPIDLVEFGRQIWGEVVPGFEGQARFLVGAEGEERTFQGDATALRPLLSNLFSNAVKYSRGAGEVMMTIIHKPRETVIRVTDFGIGIAPEDLPNIFEPFQRGANAEPMTGSGLGLAIAKACVRAMGGEIRVQSQLDKGTTFEITLPQDRGSRRGKQRRQKDGKE